MCPDHYHWRTGGGRHHKGGPHRQLSMAAGATPKYPNMRRPPGRTLSQAMHTNNYLESNPMLATQPLVSATRIGGRQGGPVAGPHRSRRKPR